MQTSKMSEGCEKDAFACGIMPYHCTETLFHGNWLTFPVTLPIIKLDILHMLMWGNVGSNRLRVGSGCRSMFENPFVC